MWCNRDRDFGSHPSAMLRWMVAKGPNRIAQPVPRLRSRLRPASVEIHFRDEIERLLRSDVGEEIIDALALFDGPLKKADDCVSALRLFRELPARGSNLRLIADIG